MNLPNKITLEKYDWKNGDIKNKKLSKNEIKFINFDEGIIEGRLLGGNLDTMAALIGTKFMPEFNEGDILFIEDSFVNAAITERNMSILKNANILKKVSCIIVGLIENYDDLGSKRKYHEILLEFLDKEIPIIYNFPCSHIQPSTILKIGAKIKINIKNKKLEIEN